MKNLKATCALIALVSMVPFLGACAHHNAATTGDNDITQVTNSNNSGGTAVVPGPAKVDSKGGVYTSSSAPGTGNADNVGTNTNVNNIVPQPSSTVSVTQSPIEQPTQAAVIQVPVTTAGGSETTITTTTETIQTPAPAPPPVVAQAPVIETPAPAPAPTMASSTTTEETVTTPAPEETKTTTTHKHHRRMAKE